MRYTFLGDRLLSVSMVSPRHHLKVVQFMADCFLVYLVDGYSNTEAGAGALAIDGHINKGNDTGLQAG